MQQLYQLNKNKPYNNNTQSAFATGRNNPESTIISNHSIIFYHNRLFYKEQNILQNIEIRNTVSKKSMNDILFGKQNNTTTISPPPAFIQYRLDQ